MGKIIVTVGAEKNVGATICSLFLGSTFSSTLNKKVLLCDLDKINPDVLGYLSDDEYSSKNIDIIMSYALCDEELYSAIKGNVEKLTNSNLEIIMGTSLHNDFTDEQYINFIKHVKDLYEIVILNFNIDNLPQVIVDYSDDVLLFIDQSKVQLKKLKETKTKLLYNEKCNVIVNKFERNLVGKNLLSKDDINLLLEKKVKFYINYSKDLMQRVNYRDLNINDSKFGVDFTNIAKEFINKYGMSNKEKFSLLKMFKGNRPASKGGMNSAEFTE